MKPIIVHACLAYIVLTSAYWSIEIAQPYSASSFKVFYSSWNKGNAIQRGLASYGEVDPFA